MKSTYIALFTILSMPMIALSNDSQERTISGILKAGLVKSVSATNGTLTLVTKDSGARFLMSVDGSPHKALRYSEKVILPKGFRSVTFAERHYSITISQKNGEADKYEITEKFDRRSLGGEVVTMTKEFSLNDSSLAEEQCK